MAGETKVGSLAIDLVGSATSFRRATFYAARDIAKFSNQVEGSAATLNRTFIGLGASAMTFLAVSTGVFASFDDRMRRSLSLFDGMTNEMRRTMATQALAMSSQMGVSANQVADSYYYLASAGFNANESLMLLSTTMKFAAASGMDAAKATEYLSDAAFALGLRSRDTAKMMKNMVMVSDLIMRATAKADATAEQFAMGLSRRAGPLIQAFNVDIKDATASLMVFANQGIKGSQASTWLSMTIRELTRSAAENREEWQRMGVAVYDNTGRMRDFASIFGDLKRMFSGMSDEDMMPTLKKLGIRQRAAQPILALMNASDELVDNVKELGEAAGQTDRIFQERMKSMLRQFSMLGNAARNVGIRIGEALVTDEGQMLLNMVKGLTKGFESLGNWIAGFSETSKRALLLFGGIFPVALVGVNLLYAAMNYLLRPLKAIYGILATRFAKPAAEDMNSAASSAGNFAVHASKLATQLNRVGTSAAKSSFSVESFITVLKTYATQVTSLMAVWEASIGGLAVPMGMLRTASVGVAKAFDKIIGSIQYLSANMREVRSTLEMFSTSMANMGAALSKHSMAIVNTGKGMLALSTAILNLQQVNERFLLTIDKVVLGIKTLGQTKVDLGVLSKSISGLGTAFGRVDKRLTSVIAKMITMNRAIRETIKLRAAEAGQDWKSIALPGGTRIMGMKQLENSFTSLSVSTRRLAVAKEREVVASGSSIASKAKEGAASIELTAKKQIEGVATDKLITAKGFYAKALSVEDTARKKNITSMVAETNARKKMASGGLGSVLSKGMMIAGAAWAFDEWIVKNITSMLGKENYGTLDIGKDLAEGAIGMATGLNANEKAMDAASNAVVKFNDVLNELPASVRDIVKESEEFKKAQRRLLEDAVDATPKGGLGGFMQRLLNPREWARQRAAAARVERAPEEVKVLVESLPDVQTLSLERAFRDFGNRMDEIMNREITLAVPAYLAEMREKNRETAEKMRIDRLSPFERENELAVELEHLRKRTAELQSQLVSLWDAGVDNIAGARLGELAKAVADFADFPDVVGDSAWELRKNIMSVGLAFKDIPGYENFFKQAENLSALLGDPKALAEAGVGAFEEFGKALVEMRNRTMEKMEEAKAGMLDAEGEIRKLDIPGAMKKMNEQFAEALFGTKTVNEQKKIIEARLNESLSAIRKMTSDFARMKMRGRDKAELNELANKIKEEAIKALGLEAELDRFKSSGADRTAGIVERGSVEAFRAERNIGVDHMRAVEKNTNRTVEELKKTNRMLSNSQIAMAL